MTTIGIVIIAVIVLAGIAFALRGKVGGRPVPAAIRPGERLPDFSAQDEDGQPVQSSSLQGSPAVLLFVRGSWCPFCSKQVANLTRYYNDITASGARLVLVTPKPLETTRRVADFFDVRFEFWLDESLDVAESLGLLNIGGVPKGHQKEYGENTLWPTSLVVDAQGVIRYAELSKFIADRPNPEKLLGIVRQLTQ